MAEKEMRYLINRKEGYPMPSGKPQLIDTEAEYFIVGCAKALNNNPIIERCDKKEYFNNTRWIVDKSDLEKSKSDQ